MNRRQSLPAEVYALPAEVYALVGATPSAVLLEGGSTRRRVNHSTADPASSTPVNSTRLFTAPSRILVAHRPEEIPALFGEIESAVAAGQCAAGFFAYESGRAFEPKVRMRADPTCPLAWL